MKAYLLMTSLCFGLFACGGDSESPAPQDTTQAVDESSVDEGPVVVENCDDVVGKVYRFDSITVIEPSDDEGVVSSLINSLWATDIETDYLNLVFPVQAYDSETGNLTFQGGGAIATDSNGVKAGEDAYDATTATYSLSPDLTFDFSTQLDECAFKTIESTQIVLLSGKVTVVDSEECSDVPGIFIQDLYLEANLETNGESLSGGHITGVLSEHVADCLEARGLIGGPDSAINFGKFMKTVGKVELNLDLDNDGTMDAWSFVADFTAASIDNYVPAN